MKRVLFATFGLLAAAHAALGAPLGESASIEGGLLPYTGRTLRRRGSNVSRRFCSLPVQAPPIEMGTPDNSPLRIRCASLRKSSPSAALLRSGTISEE